MYDSNTASSRTSKKALPNEYELWTQITGVKYPHICQSCCLQIFHPCFASSLCRSCEFSHSMCSCCLNSAPVISLLVCLGREENWTDCSSEISTEQNNVNLPKYRRKKIRGKIHHLQVYKWIFAPNASTMLSTHLSSKKKLRNWKRRFKEASQSSILQV